MICIFVFMYRTSEYVYMLTYTSFDHVHVIYMLSDHFVSLAVHKMPFNQFSNGLSASCDFLIQCPLFILSKLYASKNHIQLSLNTNITITHS